jgi:hypothetical protein
MYFSTPRWKIGKSERRVGHVVFLLPILWNGSRSCEDPIRLWWVQIITLPLINRFTLQISIPSHSPLTTFQNAFLLFW